MSPCRLLLLFIVLNEWEVRLENSRAMAQAVSRRPLTAEARFQSRVSPCGICGGQSGTGTGFSLSTSVFPCPFHSTGAPLLGKMKKNWHLHHRVVHNKPWGCGASVTSAAGALHKKKLENCYSRHALPVLLIFTKQLYLFSFAGECPVFSCCRGYTAHRKYASFEPLECKIYIVLR
jgi:hypothetical protein